MNLRKAKCEDMNQIFLMAYDTWNEGKPVDVYLMESHASTEYDEGEWFVLENPATKDLLSSLILYDFQTKHERLYGIGSVATNPLSRNNGYASELIKKVLQLVNTKKEGGYILLYSDIDPVFYEKLGFVRAPEIMQNEPEKVCMIYPRIPPYF